MPLGGKASPTAALDGLQELAQSHMRCCPRVQAAILSSSATTVTNSTLDHSLDSLHVSPAHLAGVALCNDPELIQEYPAGGSGAECADDE